MKRGIKKARKTDAVKAARRAYARAYYAAHIEARREASRLCHARKRAEAKRTFDVDPEALLAGLDI